MLLFLQLGHFIAQLAIRSSRIAEHRLQADLLGFLGFECAKGLADGINEPADGILDGVELANLGIGIEQEVAEGFVFAAKLGTQCGEQFFVEFERVVGRGWHWSALARPCCRKVRPCGQTGPRICSLT